VAVVPPLPAVLPAGGGSGEAGEVGAVWSSRAARYGLAVLPSSPSSLPVSSSGRCFLGGREPRPSSGRLPDLRFGRVSNSAAAGPRSGNKKFRLLMTSMFSASKPAKDLPRKIKRKDFRSEHFRYNQMELILFYQLKLPYPSNTVRKIFTEDDTFCAFIVGFKKT
jgi:hypothetical protein